MLAHTVHYAVVVAGLLGLTVMLSPSLLERFAPHTEQPRDEHELRVHALRARVAAGTLTHPAPQPRTTPRQTSYSAPAGSALALPLALVSSAAAAGVHAAVGPAHVAESPVFGTFFLLAAVVQVAWTVAAATRPSRALLELAVIGNVAILALWLLTRTWGLPGGLMTSPEPFGAWDVACAGWELTVVLACVSLLRSHQVGTVSGWFAWHRLARGWFVGSVLVLGVLSLSGASA